LIKALTPFARRKVLVLASQCTYGSTYHRYKGGNALIEAGALTWFKKSCGEPSLAFGFRFIPWERFRPDLVKMLQLCTIVAGAVNEFKLDSGSTAKMVGHALLT
jgi:sugar/nucleoside kinase (ribokinase family)